MYRLDAKDTSLGAKVNRKNKPTGAYHRFSRPIKGVQLMTASNERNQVKKAGCSTSQTVR